MSNPFKLTDDAIAVLRGDVKGVSGFKVGSWTHRCAEQLVAHVGPLTREQAKEIAAEHKVEASYVHKVKAKLRKAGLWDDLKSILSQVHVHGGSPLKPKKKPKGVEGEGTQLQKPKSADSVDGIGSSVGSSEKEAQPKQLLQKVESTAPSDSK